jgi:hypothetical protein
MPVAPLFQGLYVIMPKARKPAERTYVVDTLGKGVDEATGLLAGGLEPLLKDGFSQKGEAEFDFHKGQLLYITNDRNGNDAQRIQHARAHSSHRPPSKTRAQEDDFLKGYLAKAREDQRLHYLEVAYEINQKYNLLDYMAQGHPPFPPAIKQIRINTDPTQQMTYLIIHRLQSFSPKAWKARLKTQARQTAKQTNVLSRIPQNAWKHALPAQRTIPADITPNDTERSEPPKNPSPFISEATKRNALPAFSDSLDWFKKASLTLQYH